MQLKTRQIVVTLTLDCFCPVGLYSDRAHIVWIAFLALTDKLTLLPPLIYKTLWRSDALVPAFNDELHAKD